MRKLLLALMVAAIAVATFLLYVSIPVHAHHDATHILSGLKALEPRSIHVDGVALQTQPDASTCGITTISVLASFLTKERHTPQALMEQFSLTAGMNQTQFVTTLAQLIPRHAAAYQAFESDLELLRAIHRQLGTGIPVPVFFGAPNPYNKPYYDFHASLVTGLDLDRQQVNIANVYGYEEQLTLTEFLNRMAYRGGKYPLVQRAVAKLGLMDRNSLVLVTPR